MQDAHPLAPFCFQGALHAAASPRSLKKMKPRKPLSMSPHVDGRGTVMCPLPGSGGMVGGALMCMYHALEPALRIGDWVCRSLYMHIAYEKPRVYDGPDCLAVKNAVEDMRRSPDAARVLLDREHAPGHPLPGFFTVTSPRYRIDFYAYPSERGRHLWAQVYRK